MLQGGVEGVLCLDCEVLEVDALLAAAVALEEGAVAPRHVVAEHGATQPESNDGVRFILTERLRD